MKALQHRLAKLESHVVTHIAARELEASHAYTQLAASDPRAVRIAIAYDRRAREARGGKSPPWSGPDDLKGFSADELARMFNERVDALRAGRAA